MLTFIVVFFVLLLIYIHVLFHWKVSNEIDIPHVITPQKDVLEQVADSKQPFLFEKDITPITKFVMEGKNENVLLIKSDKSELSVPHKAMLTVIKKEKYLSYKNSPFVKNILLNENNTSQLDKYLTPPMMMIRKCDLIYGNHDAATKLEKSFNHRNYFICLEGSVNIKLIPPRYADKLNNNTIDLWEKNENNLECDIINLTINQCTIIHIPSYWFYTFQFHDQGCLLSLSYITYINAISQIPNKITSYIKLKKIEF